MVHLAGPLKHMIVNPSELKPRVKVHPYAYPMQTAPGQSGQNSIGSFATVITAADLGPLQFTIP